MFFWLNHNWVGRLDNSKRAANLVNRLILHLVRVHRLLCQGIQLNWTRRDGPCKTMVGGEKGTAAGRTIDLIDCQPRSILASWSSVGIYWNAFHRKDLELVPSTRHFQSSKDINDDNDSLG